jgi:hypothetical protein
VQAKRRATHLRRVEAQALEMRKLQGLEVFATAPTASAAPLAVSSAPASPVSAPAAAAAAACCPLEQHGSPTLAGAPTLNKSCLDLDQTRGPARGRAARSTRSGRCSRTSPGRAWPAAACDDRARCGRRRQ